MLTYLAAQINYYLFYFVFSEKKCPPKCLITGQVLNTAGNGCECFIKGQVVNTTSQRCECPISGQVVNEAFTCVCPANTQLNNGSDACEAKGN